MLSCIQERARGRLILSIVLIICSSGCDAGIQYRPKDWAQVSGSLYWTKAFGPAEFTILPIGGLVGQWWTGLEMFVTNHSDEYPVSIVDAVLKTKKGDYRASWFTQSHIQPGERRKSAILWDFKHEERLSDLLIEPVEVTITIRIGEEQQTVVIPMVRL
jgi:hypothetical protein